MKRKSAIKLVLGIGAMTATGVSVYEVSSWYKPVNVHYLNSKKSMISDLAELIIPATDTPGAKAAKTEEYIISTIISRVTSHEANTFINGLEKLEQLSFAHYEKAFSKCNTKQQGELLSNMRNSFFYTKRPLLTKVRSKLLGRSFFEILKDLTVIGYCTSEIGATMGLAYVNTPGHFNSCIPLQKGQRCWATK